MNYFVYYFISHRHSHPSNAQLTGISSIQCKPPDDRIECRLMVSCAVLYSSSMYTQQQLSSRHTDRNVHFCSTAAARTRHSSTSAASSSPYFETHCPSMQCRDWLLLYLCVYMWLGFLPLQSISIHLSIHPRNVQPSLFLPLPSTDHFIIL